MVLTYHSSCSMSNNDFSSRHFRKRGVNFCRPTNKIQQHYIGTGLGFIKIWLNIYRQVQIKIRSQASPVSNSLMNKKSKLKTPEVKARALLVDASNMDTERVLFCLGGWSAIGYKVHLVFRNIGCTHRLLVHYARTHTCILIHECFVKFLQTNYCNYKTKFVKWQLAPQFFLTLFSRQ